VSLDDNHQVGITVWPDGPTADGGQGQTIMGLVCGVLSPTIHFHAHLSILVDRLAYAIPAFAGIYDHDGPNQCTYGVHTHDRSGKLHCEAVATITPTLGHFFAVWGMPLTRENVAGITGLPIEFFVTEDGTVTRFTGDPATIELRSHRHIAIQIGQPIDEVPFFTWSGA
jgi:hypothetical protein